MAKPHNNNENKKRTTEIEIALIGKNSSYITRDFGC